jgi:hypothetical protein
MRCYTLAATIAAAATVLLTGTAAAQPGDIPLPGDFRATAHIGNVVERDCAELFPGSHAIAKGDLTFSVDGTNTYLDVTAEAGVTVVGIIVKGGPAYNSYPLATGDDLHAPLVSSGKPAQISHWFACGTGESETTSTTTTTESSTESSTTSTTDSGVASTTTTSSPSSSGSGSVTTTATTTSADVVTAADENDLASTGFNGGWLVVLAVVLLAGGGALLVLGRGRAARR